MSDGPYKSLPIRREWKKVAERAINEAYSVGEICEAIVAAVTKDLQKAKLPDLIVSIQEVISGRMLFCEDPIPYLENFRRAVSGNMIGNALLDFLLCAISRGKSEQETLSEAIAATLADHIERRERQVEEHCLRDSRNLAARNVRERMAKAIRLADIKLLIDQILSSGAKLNLQITKHDKVDDGVEL